MRSGIKTSLAPLTVFVWDIRRSWHSPSNHPSRPHFQRHAEKATQQIEKCEWLHSICHGKLYRFCYDMKQVSQVQRLTLRGETGYGILIASSTIALYFLSGFIIS